MRRLTQKIPARATSDGDGVRIRRIGGERVNDLIDPFLLLDEINSDDAADYIGGFPEHPHRGMETITYMKAGRMRHRDHMGNEGVIGPGDVQWMTAGRGVLHSEKPEQESGLLHGFQLWLNLPVAEKLKPAAYRDIRMHEIPSTETANGARVAVIAGDVVVNSEVELQGALPEFSTQPVMIDVSLPKNGLLSLQFDAQNPAFVYVIAGSLGGEIVLEKSELGVFSEGDSLVLQSGKNGASLLVLSGRPLKESIVQYGPFVMNTQQEIDVAIQDYRAGRLV